MSKLLLFLYLPIRPFSSFPKPFHSFPKFRYCSTFSYLFPFLFHNLSLFSSSYFFYLFSFIPYNRLILLLPDPCPFIMPSTFSFFAPSLPYPLLLPIPSHFLLPSLTPFLPPIYISLSFPMFPMPLPLPSRFPHFSLPFFLYAPLFSSLHLSLSSPSPFSS